MKWVTNQKSLECRFQHYEVLVHVYLLKPLYLFLQYPQILSLCCSCKLLHGGRSLRFLILQNFFPFNWGLWLCWGRSHILPGITWEWCGLSLEWFFPDSIQLWRKHEKRHTIIFLMLWIALLTYLLYLKSFESDLKISLCLYAYRRGLFVSEEMAAAGKWYWKNKINRKFDNIMNIKKALFPCWRWVTKFGANLISN